MATDVKKQIDAISMCLGGGGGKPRLLNNTYLNWSKIV